MIRLDKATENNRESILDYCSKEPVMNIFIIGDIELYGFESDFQEVWLQFDEQEIQGVVLRYHENFIIYSDKDEFEVSYVKELLIKYNAKMISGKSEIINRLYLLLNDEYNVKQMYFTELVDINKIKEAPHNVEEAKEGDAMEIAETYGEVDEFVGVYSPDVNIRYQQIVSRIKHNEGKHAFIRNNGKIISHGNTAAETSSGAMIGGLFTIKKHRKAGLATRVVSYLSKPLLEGNKKVCMLVDDLDENKFIKSLGFEAVGGWSILSKR